MMVAIVIICLLLCFGSCLCVTGTLRECVHSGSESIACVNKIPTIIPKEITHVFLEFVSANISFEGNIFNHASWENITYLDITAKYEQMYGYYDIDLSAMRFWRLKGLKELKVHGEEISVVSKDTFRTITHLSVLEFSNCRKLKFKTLVDSLLAVNITIDKLFLNDISTASGQYCYINGLFLKFLRNKKVTVLNLRHSVIKMTILKTFDIIRLKELDVSNVIIILDGLHQQTFYNMIVPFLGELITLNASAIPMQLFLPDPYFLKDKVVTGCHGLHHTLIEILFLRLENLYVNKIFTVPIVINNTLLNISDCKFTLKRWHFSENHLQYFNVTAILPINNTLFDINFSDNEITYISSTALRTLTSLEILNLGRNKLNIMETLPEFEDLFVNLMALKYLNLAENGFSHLPQNLLRNNQALHSLDLSGNYLTSLTVSLKHLESLRLLDLSRNHIKFLKDNELVNVQIFSKSPISADSNETANTELAGNPLECSCESSQFILWVIMVKRQQPHKRYFCTMENAENEIEINEDTLKRAKFLCYRTTVIVCSIVSFFVLIVIILSLIARIRRNNRRQKQKNAERAFLNDLLKDVLREKYLCHISYASKDEMCVLEYIYKKLSYALTTFVGTRRDFICIGDKEYCLGRPIVNEILRCISESCVMLFIISESFCRSHWCEMELREAYELEKPMILIFKEHVKEDMMSTVLQTIFSRMTRAKLVENDGAYTLIPDWKNLGESIIKLAAEKYMSEK